jgi:hypothetical protein
MFNQPEASGSFFKPSEADGHTILILQVNKIERRHDTLRGEEIDQVSADLVDLSGSKTVQQNVFLTHKGITNRLSPQSRMVLGRIGQVDTKSGMKAWVLLPYQPEDEKVATDWINNNQQPAQVTAPSAGTDEVAAAQALLTQLGVQIKQ